ncbi:MAG: hypothetical protein ABI718_10305 [Acidobacteriota bacterium]
MFGFGAVRRGARFGPAGVADFFAAIAAARAGAFRAPFEDALRAGRAVTLRRDFFAPRDEVIVLPDAFFELFPALLPFALTTVLRAAFFGEALARFGAVALTRFFALFFRTLFFETLFFAALFFGALFFATLFFATLFFGAVRSFTDPRAGFAFEALFRPPRFADGFDFPEDFLAEVRFADIFLPDAFLLRVAILSPFFRPVDRVGRLIASGRALKLGPSPDSGKPNVPA